jgi:hypothetical protein
MAVFVADKIGIEPHGADRQNQPGAAGQPNGIYRGQEQIAREITKNDLDKTSITPDLQRKIETAATACRPWRADKTCCQISRWRE